jgi:hypothetical protein
MNKTALILVMTVIIGIILVRLFLPYGNYYIEYDITIKVVEAIVLIMIARSGTTIKTIYYRIFQFCLGIYAIGALFKIMHWGGGFELLSLSLTGIAVTYLIRFMNKKNKTALDVFKMMLVISIAAETILKLGHLVKREYLIMSELSGWFVILAFAIEVYKKGLPEKSASK